MGKATGAPAALRKQDTYTTGKLARIAEVNLQTIRYYERSGLLPSPERDDSGYRQYDDGALKRLQFIRKSQTLGFSLKEIQRLLDMKDGVDHSCSDVAGLVQARIEAVRHTIDDLKQIESVLTEIVADCEENRKASDCPCFQEIEKRDVLIQKTVGH